MRQEAHEWIPERVRPDDQEPGLSIGCRWIGVPKGTTKRTAPHEREPAAPWRATSRVRKQKSAEGIVGLRTEGPNAERGEAIL
jgi:hypothetical protein